MNFFIGCCEKQPIRKSGKRLRSYEKENRSLIPAGDKVPILKIRRCSVHSRNVIYCIRCTACNQLYIGEKGRRLGDRFREHLLDVKNNSQDVSKPVARHFNQPGHSHNNMKIFGLSLHQGNTESRKCTEQRLIFKIGCFSQQPIKKFIHFL